MIDSWTPEVERIALATLGQGIRTLGITSPGGTSGVSTLCINLAHITALSGVSTLLIDLTRPVLNNTPEGIWRPGSKASRYAKVIDPDRQLANSAATASSYLSSPSGDASANNLIAHYGTARVLARDPRGFDVLTAGFSASTRFLFNNVERLKQSFDDELSRYRAIIVDIPPLCVAEATNINGAAAAAACDGVLLVCVSGRITRAELIQSAAALQSAKANVVGTVLNDVDCPSVGAELAREAARLEPFAPRFANWIRGRALNSPFLSSAAA